MKPLVQRIDEFLIHRRRERDLKYEEHVKARGYRFSPYLAGKCTRRAVYTLLRFPEPEMTPGALRIIENGNSMQERYQLWLKEAGILIQKEYPVQSEELLISGRCDGILLIDNKLYVLELKSTGLANFQEMARTKRPDPEYVDQIMLYMHLTEIPNGIILVEGIITDRGKVQAPPDDPESGFYMSEHLLEFHLCYDPDHAARLIEKVKKINDCVAKEVLPERDYPLNSKQCRFCPFRERCWFFDPDIGRPRQ